MLLSCHINLVKFENFGLSKIFGMTYNLERREYATLFFLYSHKVLRPMLFMFNRDSHGNNFES